MPELYVYRTARKEHECAWGCGHPIAPGQRYVRASLPPWEGENESDHWLTVALHDRDSQCVIYAPPDAPEAQPGFSEPDSMYYPPEFNRSAPASPSPPTSEPIPAPTAPPEEDDRG